VSNRGLAILTRRHPGVELLVKRAHSWPAGWLSVEAYDTPKGADRPCFHWYVVGPTGRVWTSPDGERRTVELRTAA
jgi:hypothetical protein